MSRSLPTGSNIFGANSSQENLTADDIRWLLNAARSKASRVSSIDLALKDIQRPDPLDEVRAEQSAMVESALAEQLAAVKLLVTGASVADARRALVEAAEMAAGRDAELEAAQAFRLEARRTQARREAAARQQPVVVQPTPPPPRQPENFGPVPRRISLPDDE